MSSGGRWLRCTLLAMVLTAVAAGSAVGEPLFPPPQQPAVPAATSAEGGFAHTCARRDDGRVWCWGDNSHGQLGAGDAGGASTVPLVVRALPPVAQVSAGGDFSCVLSASGAVWCWGANDAGQLGDGTTTDASTPQQVSVDGAVWVAAGKRHVCIVRRDGSAWCWGDNTQGQLGNRTATSTSVPVLVTDKHGRPLTGVAAIEAGGATTCATLTDGSGWCWGSNDHGQLGNGLTGDATSADRIGSPQGGRRLLLVGIAVGAQHACALTVDAAVWCWGDNSFGQLGNGTNKSSARPVRAALSGPTRRLGSATGSHTCAVADVAGREESAPLSADLPPPIDDEDGAMGAVCWGAGTGGQLGSGTSTDSAVPVVVVDTLGNPKTAVDSISTGAHHTCLTELRDGALTNDGDESTVDSQVFCFGANSSGQLGTGTLIDQDRAVVPVPVP